MRRTAALAFAVALLPAIALAGPSATCGAPADLHDGWKVAAPADEGLDPKLICAIGPRLGKMTEAGPHAVVIVRHGVLVYEHYFTEGSGANTLHNLYSITKSVTALLTGIAFDRGWLHDIDASAFSFLPRYADLSTPEKARISLRDLLTMSSGLAWPELGVSYGDPANAWRQMSSAPDPFRFLLGRPLAATPGAVWNYDSGGVELLGVILEKTSGQSLDQIAKTALFDPLGITDWHSGAASYGLELRPRDLAKIGQLVLNRGDWHERRIVSASWIKAMTTPQIPLPPDPRHRGWGLFGYGYLWWLGRSTVGDREIDWAAGFGIGGQRLYVVSSLDLIVAVTAGDFVFGSPHGQGRAGRMARDTALRAALMH